MTSHERHVKQREHHGRNWL